MLDHLHEEKRNIDFILDQTARVFDWQLDLLRLDLTSLQRSILKKHRCRGESIHEVALHLGTDVESVAVIYESAMKRLRRYRKTLEFKTRLASEPRPATFVCQACGTTNTRRRSREFCEACTPRNFLGYSYREAL